MMITKAIETVSMYGGEIVIRATSPAHAESLRVSGYHARSRMPKKLVEDISLTKFEQDEEWFVRVYKKEDLDVWVKDPISGKYVPMSMEIQDITSPSSILTQDAELTRIIELMKADGKSETEIKEVITSWG
jgi:hypothetical protein